MICTKTFLAVSSSYSILLLCSVHAKTSHTLAELYHYLSLVMDYTTSGDPRTYRLASYTSKRLNSFFISCHVPQSRYNCNGMKIKQTTLLHKSSTFHSGPYLIHSCPVTPLWILHGRRSTAYRF